MGAIQKSINSLIGTMAIARIFGRVKEKKQQLSKAEPIETPKESQEAATTQIAINPNLTFGQILKQNPIGLLDLQQSIQDEGMKPTVDNQKKNWNERKKALKARKRK